MIVQIVNLGRLLGHTPYGWLRLRRWDDEREMECSHVSTLVKWLPCVAVMERGTAGFAALNASYRPVNRYLPASVRAWGSERLRRGLENVFAKLIHADLDTTIWLVKKMAILAETVELTSSVFERPVQIFQTIGELVPTIRTLWSKGWSMIGIVCLVSPVLTWIKAKASSRSVAAQREYNRLIAQRRTIDSQLLAHLRTVKAYGHGAS